MRKRIYILTILVLGLSFTSYSQNLSSENKKALKYYTEAAQMMKRVQYPESIEPLKKALDRDQNFIEAWQLLGLCYSKTGQLEEAILAHESAIKFGGQSKRIPISYYALADLYFQVEEHEKAIQYSELYKTEKQNDTKKIARLNKIIGDSQFVIEAKKHELAYNITPLGGKANYFKQQYFPVLTVDQQSIFFTGRNKDEDIYVSRLDSVGEWSMPASLSPNINTPLNEGACTISADGRTLIFTSCQGRRGFGSCDLYITYRVGNDWATPTNLGPVVNGGGWDVQPTLSADGRTLYFVSDRPGGMGGKDIWKTSKDDKDEWKEPVNLGYPVNTRSDEISPFIHVNGESLYFSSKGHIGMGGYDIYMSEMDGNEWSEPKNLGFPLNDHNDQVSLYISSDGLKGYYTIEKIVEGDWRSTLHSFDVPEDLRIKHRSVFTAGHVKDKMTGEFLDADIKLYDLSTSKLISKVKSDKITGEYTVVLSEGNEYGLYVERKGYLFADYSFELGKIESFNQSHLEVELQPIQEGAHMVLHNIYFDFDSFHLKPESHSELQVVYEFLKANRNVTIEIAGYTDDKGSYAYNKQLSSDRARSVYEFLINKKVPSRMLSYKGYGAQNFITLNDTEENRAKNRRIEFKIASIAK